MMMYGYIRVSTKEQNTDRQYDAVTAYGVVPKHLFIDRQSGKDFDRPAYRQLLKKLRRHDLIVLKSIDRLGRDYDEIIEQWKYITRDRGVDIVILDMPLLDTRRDKDLLGTFIGDLVLQILSFVSQTERDSLRQRQAEGIAAAQRRGVHCGRPRREIPGWTTAVIEWRAGMLTAAQAARQTGLSISGFYKRVQRDPVSPC